MKSEMHTRRGSLKGDSASMAVVTTGCRAMMLAMFAFAATSAFAWGPGHDTVARQTLKLLPGEF